MPSGIYTRTEKHRSINVGRKHPNRKKPISKGLTPIPKNCLFCKKDFITNCFMPKKKYCSTSCRAKNNLELNLLKLTKGRVNQKEMMQNKKGELHPRWIKDRNNLLKSEKKHLDSRYKEWMLAVKNRDNWKCKINNKDCGGRLEAHHILNWKDYKELRYDVNNGITLCCKHHPRKRSEETRLSQYFKNLLKTL